MPEDLIIRRHWDIDSIFFGMSSLAVHRRGFYFALRPPFLRRITQNARVTIHNLPLHKTKQLRIGYGVGDAGLQASTYVMFPHLRIPVRGETHLTTAEQTCWVDDIIAPALRETCGHEIRQHWPRGFSDADRKARCKGEHMGNPGQPIDLKYVIPASRCRVFWDCVLRKSEEHPDFRQPALVVAAHNLKLHTQRPTAAQAKADFIQHLESCYDLDGEHTFRTNDSWIDLGVEDVPVSDRVTLLRKTHCLEQWASAFRDPQDQQRLRLTVERYPFMLTRDAGSISVELGTSNGLRCKGGLSFVKAYNIHHTHFDTPLDRTYPIFGKEQHEALGFDQRHIDRCVDVNRHGETAAGTRESHLKRSDLVAEFEMMKQRVATALLAAEQHRSSLGVRSECRISWALFTQNELPGDEHTYTIPRLSLDDVGVAPEIPHRSYWALPTAMVNQFIAAWVNRWVFCLEASAVRCTLGPDRPVAPQDEQRLRGITISACRRTLALGFGGAPPAQRPELMRERLESREQRRRRIQRLRREELGIHPDSDDDEAPESLLSDNVEEPEGPLRVGLGFTRSLEQYGTVWLQPDQLLGEGLPVFKPALFERSIFPLAQNTFYRSFRRIKDLPAALTEQDRRRGHFRQGCVALRPLMDAVWASEHLPRELPEVKEAVDRVKPPMFALFALAAELVLQSYIQCVFDRLGARATKCDGFPRSAVGARATLLEPLTRDEADGACGLTWSMVNRLLGYEPRLVRARAARTSKQKATIFGRYQDSGLWRDRVSGLFLHDDLGDVTRRWDTLAFRTLTRHLLGIVEQVVHPRMGELFLDEMVNHISQRIFIFPQYDRDHLSVVWKPNRGYVEETKQAIRDLDDLQKTNWYMAAFSPAQKDAVGALCDPPWRNSVTPFKVARRQLRKEVVCNRLVVSTDATNDHHQVIDPEFFDLPLLSTHLRQMEEELRMAPAQPGAAESNQEGTTTDDDSEEDL